MNRPKDSQRSAVYRWENRLVDSRLNKICEDPDSVIQEIWRRYVPYGHGRLPSVHVTRSNRANRHRVLIARDACLLTVIHEAVHAVLDHMMGSKAAWHGPEFARMALDLYDWFASPEFSKVKARSLGVNQKPRRVRFAPRDAVPPVLPMAARSKARITKLDRLRTRYLKLRAEADEALKELHRAQREHPTAT